MGGAEDGQAACTAGVGTDAGAVGVCLCGASGSGTPAEPGAPAGGHGTESQDSARPGRESREITEAERGNGFSELLIWGRALLGVRDGNDQ